MPSPAVFMLAEVPDLAFLVVRHRANATLADSQPSSRRLLEEAELDQRRVALVGSLALWMVPAEGKTAEGLRIHDSDRHDQGRIFLSPATSGPPCERPLSTGASLDPRSLVAEPAA